MTVGFDLVLICWDSWCVKIEKKNDEKKKSEKNSKILKDQKVVFTAKIS